MDRERIFSIIDSLLKQGDLAVQSGDLNAARDSYKRAKDIAYSSTQKREGSYAIACDKLGDVARFSREFSTARKEYSTALPIFQMLAKQHERHRRDVSLCLSKIGELEIEEQNFQAAKQAFEEHYTMAKTIAESNPIDSESQRDLAGAHGRMYLLACAMDNERESLRHAKAQYEIIKRIAPTDPSSVILTEELAGAMAVYGAAVHNTGDTKSGLMLLKKAADTIRALAKKNKLGPKGKRLLSDMERQGF